MNRSILADRIDVVKAEREAERELDRLYRPAVQMRTPGAARSKIYLTNGTVVTPRPGVTPQPISSSEVHAARAYCPGVRLSDTVLAFGPFKGLTFGQVRALRAGDKANDFEVTSDTEGVRYLDRLLSEDWIYPVTRTRLALYLSNSNVKRELLQAIGPVVRDEAGAAWPAGGLDAGLCFPPYGDGDDGSLKPDDFSITGTPVFDPATGRDSWNGGAFEEGPWKGQGAPAFLAHPHAGRGAKVRRAEEFTALDPTPGNWRLDDPVRQERGTDADDEDGWIDMQMVADNDVQWDWQPEPGLTEFRAWQLGLDYVQQLERLGECSHRTPEEALEALKELVGYDKEVRSDVECGPVKVYGEIHRRLGLFEGRFRWHPAVAESLRKAIGQAVGDAQERIEEWRLEAQSELRERLQDAEDYRRDRNRWRGLDALSRRRRVKKERIAKLQAATVG